MALETFADRIVKMCHDRKDIIRNEIGDWVYWQTEQSRGFLTAYEMRIISEELDRLNEKSAETKV